MGVTVRQKEKGKGKPWWVFIHHDRIIRSKKVGDRQAALAVASLIRKQLKAGELKLPQEDAGSLAPHFGEYAAHYIEAYAKAACKHATWRNYEMVIKNHLNPHWRNKRLDQIRRADVKRLLLTKQQEGFSPKTVENIKALISGIFSQAYEDEIVESNPALKLGRFIQKQDKRRHICCLTKEQSAQLLAACREHYPEHYPVLLCALRTGMRLGELMGLAWGDVDFTANSINVQRAYSHNRFSTPKSRRFRIVDMSNQLRATLLDQRDTLLSRFRGKLPNVEVPGQPRQRSFIQMCFPNRGGEPSCGDNFRQRVWCKLIEKADVPKIRIHDLRHTFASLLLANGESLHYVKEQMGHASIQTTVDVYGHLVPGSNRNAVNRLDDDEGPLLRLAENGR